MRASFAELVILGLALLLGGSHGQGLGDLFVEYDSSCDILGSSGLWIVNSHCKNYNGSVACIPIPGSEFGQKCQCNLGDGAYFDKDLQVCLGKVNAVCTAEKTTLVPPKLCTPNADCVPDQSEGHTVGKCKCIYGYKEDDNGRCVEDESIGAGDRSTPRTTTTTEAPERGSLKLPLKLLLGNTIVGLGSECTGTGGLLPLLNHTYCDTHQRTVACLDKKCQCNMGSADSIFDEELGLCVGLAGSYCLTRRNLLGWKACVKGADCVLENGLSEDYSFGNCRCLYGYDEQDDGTCKRNPNIPDPSTGRPGPTPPTSPTPSPPTTTLGPEVTTGAADKITFASTAFVAAMSVLYFM